MAQARAPNEGLPGPAHEFINRCKTELNWEDLSNDTLMDIGCGAHFLCTRALLEKFPRMGCLFATDKYRVISKKIMEDEFFAEYFRNSILQFHLVDIADSSESSGMVSGKADTGSSMMVNGKTGTASVRLTDRLASGLVSFYLLRNPIMDRTPVFIKKTDSGKIHWRHWNNGSSLEDYRNRVNKIVCRNVLQHITNKEMAFQNMYDLLRPGGHAGIMFIIANPFQTWLQKISTNWAQYRRIGLSCTTLQISKTVLQDCIEDIGFRVVRCERSDVPLQFLNDQSLLRELLSLSTVILEIPEDRMTQFKEESVSIFKELIVYSGSGPIRYEVSELLLLAIKP
ncbi:uncharacterized protein TNCV_2539731 [Trichonephila clavipes]|uniref:Uncharacterized protein n=1 Tax=Trichonephila clavipes TaxID=2585209 RepID=A0A8X6SNQ2_TRICX|nr:uncharacterized protein TNCV_2539731 [Trichonephila clavipes]